jgi:U3 small nucleolar RNA-associated protein 10
MKEKVVPCLVQFGSKVIHLKDDSLLKQLNYQLLMKTRESSVKVRLGSLWSLQELYESMGDDFLVHLPETIPFMAELLEDDDERVEMECRKLIKTVESFLGESIQEHLKK